MVEFAIKVSPGYIGTHLQKDLNLNYTQVGLYSAIFYIAYACLQLPAGILVHSYGIKKNFLILLIIFISGLFLTSYAQSFLSVCLARVMMGIGSAITFTTLLTLALRWFDEKHFPFYVGITNLFGMLGPICLASSFYFLNIENHWQKIFSLLGFTLSAFTVILIFLPETKEQAHSEKLSWQSIREILVNTFFWSYLLIAVVMVIPIAIIPEMWGSFYLEQYHLLDKQQIPFLISLVFCGIAVGGPTIGLLSRALGINTLLKIGLLGEALVLTLITLDCGKFIFIPLFFIGFFASSMLLSFTLLKDRFKPIAPVAIALFNMLLTIGSSLTQPLVGFILDLNSSLSLGQELTYCLLALSFINVLLALSLKPPHTTNAAYN